ncbi:MAG TPA: HD domain-containing phosphohydrolase [Pyrinomonadaceae bacterium]
MYPLFPFVPQKRNITAVNKWAIRSVLLAVAMLGQEEQPELYRHVQPHGHATARLTRAVAESIGCADEFNGPTLDEIELGAHLHDFGKYLIAKSILLKPGPLTDEERLAVSLHPIYGVQVLSSLPALSERVLEIVLYHHERWDGRGYPDGLMGVQIPLAARLVSIVDVYTSLRAKRAYKASLTRDDAALTIKEMAGGELDPAMTEDFLKFIGA